MAASCATPRWVARREHGPPRVLWFCLPCRARECKCRQSSTKTWPGPQGPARSRTLSAQGWMLSSWKQHTSSQQGTRTPGLSFRSCILGRRPVQSMEIRYVLGAPIKILRAHESEKPRKAAREQSTRGLLCSWGYPAAGIGALPQSSRGFSRMATMPR